MAIDLSYENAPCERLEGSDETIPANTIIEIPFPIPNSEISSPIHITNIAPATTDNTRQCFTKQCW